MKIDVIRVFLKGNKKIVKVVENGRIPVEKDTIIELGIMLPLKKNKYILIDVENKDIYEGKDFEILERVKSDIINSDFENKFYEFVDNINELSALISETDPINDFGSLLKLRKKLELNYNKIILLINNIKMFQDNKDNKDFNLKLKSFEVNSENNNTLNLITKNHFTEISGDLTVIGYLIEDVNGFDYLCGYMKNSLHIYDTLCLINIGKTKGIKGPLVFASDFNYRKEGMKKGLVEEEIKRIKELIEKEFTFYKVINDLGKVSKDLKEKMLVERKNQNNFSKIEDILSSSDFKNLEELSAIKDKETERIKKDYKKDREAINYIDDFFDKIVKIPVEKMKENKDSEVKTEDFLNLFDEIKNMVANESRKFSSRDRDTKSTGQIKREDIKNKFFNMVDNILDSNEYSQKTKEHLKNSKARYYMQFLKDIIAKQIVSGAQYSIPKIIEEMKLKLKALADSIEENLTEESSKKEREEFLRRREEELKRQKEEIEREEKLTRNKKNIQKNVNEVEKLFKDILDITIGDIFKK